jgi:KaiC/GvpD/RAD55 family RecA-like ATPase
MTLENTILANVIFNREYFSKVFPFIKEEYFDDNSSKKIFNSVTQYVEKYGEPPSMEALKISLENRKDLNETLFKEISEKVDELKIDKDTSIDWLTNETERFCQDKDLYNSIRRAILILDGQDKELDKGAIPEILSKSLSISFDKHIGHDFLEDFEKRYEYYHRKEERIPFDIDIMNTITKGGLPKKSMTLFLGTTGTGKSIVKCHMAASHLMFGKNVLYITAELSEEEVARRIDANIMGITLDEVPLLPLSSFEKKMEKYKEKTPGKLIIKEYPTSSAHVGHIRHLLNELKRKRGFVPDVLYLDYLNIMASVRVKAGSSANSYTLIKSIAEEVRGLAVEHKIPIVTSSQLNRGAYENSDVDLSNTSESMGLGHTADAVFALISTEELQSLNQIMVKQLKNRWSDISLNRRFVVGMDKSRMKLYNTENSAQLEDFNKKKPEKGFGDKSDNSDKSSDWGFNNPKKKKSLFSVEGLK